MANAKWLILVLTCLVQNPAWCESLRLQGYGEGDYLRIGSTGSGSLTDLPLEEGAEVVAGQTLFSLDATLEKADLDRRRADLAQARDVAADLRKGKRPDEVKSIVAHEADARAALKLAEQTLERQAALARQDFASRARLDEAQAEADRARAQLRAAEAEHRVAELGARSDEISAQDALVGEHEAALRQAAKRVADLAPTAPAAGRIEKIYYRVGEVVPSGKPVVSLLPPGNVKLVFFVPEAALGRLRPGQAVMASCDGCPPFEARVSFIGAEAEYTPPVLYSVENRRKLVYRVEARGTPSAPLPIRPGQPVDIEIKDEAR